MRQEAVEHHERPGAHLQRHEARVREGDVIEPDNNNQGAPAPAPVVIQLPGNARAHAVLFPQGLAITRWKYAEKIGEATLLAARRTPILRAQARARTPARPRRRSRHQGS
jgi:hypothetical protein